jgi:hypothetical protein
MVLLNSPFRLRETLYFPTLLQHDDPLSFRTYPDPALIILNERSCSERTAEVDGSRLSVIDPGHPFDGTSHPDGTRGIPIDGDHMVRRQSRRPQ